MVMTAHAENEMVKCALGQRRDGAGEPHRALSAAALRRSRRGAPRRWRRVARYSHHRWRS
jgi:hypothetical protein